MGNRRKHKVSARELLVQRLCAIQLVHIRVWLSTPCVHADRGHAKSFAQPCSFTACITDAYEECRCAGNIHAGSSAGRQLDVFVPQLLAVVPVHLAVDAEH
jgi:hypothetical protein